MSNITSIAAKNSVKFMAKLKSVEDIDFKNKRVIIRTGFDVPVDDKGKILSDKRIKESVATINYILKQMPTQVIIMTHLGRPKNNEASLKTDNVAKRLGELINMPVKKVDGWDTKACRPIDCIVMLENLRFNPAEKSKDQKERDEFGKKLASLADIYVNEAFSNCHRDHASMTSVPNYIPGCIGLNVKTEVETITDAINKPEKPFVSIIGGLKADKIPTIKNLLKKADNILVGGALAFLILKVQGKNVGKTKIDIEGLKDAEQEIKAILKDKKLILPTDCVVAEEISDKAKTKIVSVDNIPDNMMALDIGPETIKDFDKIIVKANTVIWNGPIGVFECAKFSNGTKKVGEAIARSKAESIIGGGDSASAAEKFNYYKNISFVSSGGGASLKLFEGKDLVALKALER